MEYLITLCVLFLSTFIRSALGFGDAVIAMPLLAMAIGMRTATPLVAFAATTIAVTIVIRNWRAVDLKASWRLVLSSCVGIPIGLALLKGVSEDTMKALLGVIIALYGIYNLAKPGLKLANDRFGVSYLFGFFAGILGGAYNTNGPLVVIYATLRDWPPARFRATLQGYFLPTGFMILVGHGIAGLWTADVVRLYAAALPAIAAAIFLGGIANRAIPMGRFDRFVNAALTFMGIALFWQTVVS